MIWQKSYGAYKKDKTSVKALKRMKHEDIHVRN